LAISYLNELFEGDLVKAPYNTNLKILPDKLTSPNIRYTTLTSVNIKDKLILAYVGDSPVFIIRNNTIGKLTIPNTKTI